MKGVNKAIVVGFLGSDPYITKTSRGKLIVNISVATSDEWYDNHGYKQERTDWHKVAFFDRLAEIAQEYLKKGSQVYVEGKMRTNDFTDAKGVQRSNTVVNAEVLQIISSPNAQSTTYRKNPLPSQPTTTNSPTLGLGQGFPDNPQPFQVNINNAHSFNPAGFVDVFIDPEQ